MLNVFFLLLLIYFNNEIQSITHEFLMLEQQNEGLEHTHFRK